ncbi:MAG: hypothetical protein ACJAZP_000355 [Psychromonas sp.]|jgi:hypothetical protein
MLSKNSLIMVILFFIALSIISSGLLSALFDLGAFVLLCFVLFFQQNKVKK